MAYFFCIWCCNKYACPAICIPFNSWDAAHESFLSGRKSSSEPRCVASSTRWEHKTGTLFMEHHDGHSRGGGSRQMETGLWFVRLIFPCQWWHLDTTWLRVAELWHNIGCDRNTSLSSIFRLATFLDFKELFCNLSLCISVVWKQY